MNSCRAMLGVLLTLLFCFPVFLLSERDGPEPRRTDGKLASGANFPGEGTCSNSECHNVTPNTGAGGVEISINGGPIDNYQYTLGETVRVQVNVSDPDPLQQRFGFQITSRTPDGCQQAGTFTPTGTDPQVQIIEDFDQFDPCPPLTRGLQFPEHLFAKFGPDMATYEVNWTAPATDIGPVIFAAGGNAANGDQENTGDSIYHTQETVESKGGPPPPPSHEVSGVFDAAGFQALISPGSIVAIGGAFTDTTAVASTVPLSTNLNGFSVTFNDVEGALFGVFEGAFDQANVQVPWDLDVSSGTVDVRVHWQDATGTVWSDPFTVPAGLASPGIFEFPVGQAIVTNFSLGDDGVIQDSWAQPDGSVPDPNVVTQSAAIGGVITLWGNGLGPVMPAPPPTGAAPGIALFVEKTIRVLVGGVQAAVLGSVLHGGSIGLNQINAIVPDGVTPGDAVPIVIEVDCGDGNVFRSREDVTIAVRPRP